MKDKMKIQHDNHRLTFQQFLQVDTVADISNYNLVCFNEKKTLSSISHTTTFISVTSLIFCTWNNITKWPSNMLAKA